MRAAEIIETVSRSGGQMWLEGDKVRARLPEDLQTLVEDIRRCKLEIVLLLRATGEPVFALAHEDPVAWAEDCYKWALCNCVYRDRCFGKIGVLHRSFYEWAIAHKSVPCTRQTFDRLLVHHGFFLADGMVSGLILKEDLWALEPRPAPAKPPDEHYGKNRNLMFPRARRVENGWNFGQSAGDEVVNGSASTSTPPLSDDATDKN